MKIYNKLTFSKYMILFLISLILVQTAYGLSKKTKSNKKASNKNPFQFSNHADNLLQEVINKTEKIHLNLSDFEIYKINTNKTHFEENSFNQSSSLAQNIADLGIKIFGGEHYEQKETMKKDQHKENIHKNEQKEIIKKDEQIEIIKQDVFIVPKKDLKFENVEIVKQISPAGKAALNIDKDVEYVKLMNAGYETPTMVTSIVSHHATKVKTPNGGISYKWKPSAPGDESLWQNVELHRYGNNIIESHIYRTPAKLVSDDLGNVVVHAPENSSMQILTKVPQIQVINFLDKSNKKTKKNIKKNNLKK